MGDLLRRVAVIGSGVAGLVAAHGLRRAGHAVTVFSDRTPEQWLRESRPTGTAARFAPALAYERELGLNHWEDEAPKVEGAHIVYCPRPKNRLATLTGRQPAPAVAIDVRLQSHRWMIDLEARGGKVVIERVDVARLDAIAADHDLTLVATGKSDLAQLFPRDAARSVYSAPRRNLAMITVKGPSLMRDEVPFSAVKNNIFEGIGEVVWIPYFHRDAGACWNLIFEAKAGGPLDVFQRVKSGAEAVDRAYGLIKQLAPWDAEWARGMDLADEQGWLAGSVTPTVREPVGTLPSGRVVMCIGDAAVHFDPLAAQGANNGTKMARALVDRVRARADGALDAAWMKETFDGFWESQGRPAYELTNLMLEPMSRAGIELLLAQYGCDGTRKDGRQAIADLFAAGFADPELLVPMLTDRALARRTIEAFTGKAWWRAVARGAAGVARAQIRHQIGLSPGHPAAAPPAGGVSRGGTS